MSDELMTFITAFQRIYLIYYLKPSVKGKYMRKKSKRGYRPTRQRQLPWQWLAIGGALVLILGGLGIAWMSPNARPAETPVVNGSPRLVVDRTLVDEGHVKLDSPIRSQFSLSNVGDQLLQVLEEPQVELVEGC
jgi:hypothetical protein